MSDIRRREMEWMADCKHGAQHRSFFIGIEPEDDDTFALVMQCDCGTVIRTPGLMVERWRAEGLGLSRPRFGIALKDSDGRRVFRVDVSKGADDGSS